VHRRGVILGPTRAVVFLLPIAIILLVPLLRIGVHAMANVGVAGGVIETSGNV
jgi:hypothetical protein